jgi:hypothetical protein
MHHLHLQKPESQTKKTAESGGSACYLLLLVSCLAYFLTLETEVVCPTETLGFL